MNKRQKMEKGENKRVGVVKALLRLYAHQPGAISDLENMCRLNPDFTSSSRNDLEFYIPQLITFLLKGDGDAQEE